MPDDNPAAWPSSYPFDEHPGEVHEYLITDGRGERIVHAGSPEEAARKGRYEMDWTGRAAGQPMPAPGSDAIGMIDRGEPGEVQNLTLYPNEGFRSCCGRGERVPHQTGCREAHDD